MLAVLPLPLPLPLLPLNTRTKKNRLDDFFFRMQRKAEYRIRAHEWTTVATHFTPIPEPIHLEVWSPTRIKWRRIGLIPGFGTFRKHTSLLNWLGIIQIRMYESRTCTVYHGGDPPPGLGQETPTPTAKKAQYAMKHLPQSSKS